MLVEADRFFTNEEHRKIKTGRIPSHIAIIPDGNRRWANQRDSDKLVGHEKGSDVVMDIVKCAKELAVKTLTFYTFSTENWTRSQEEIDGLFFLLANYLKTQKKRMVANGVRYHTIGDLSPFPQDLLDAIEEVKIATSHCHDINFVMAMNYGSRDEIRRAAKKLLEDGLSGKVRPEEITEDLLASYLDTAPYQDPELLIRTSGEVRVSNFLLWQISYAEIYYSNVFWPDFTPHHFYQAVTEFQQRSWRGGS